MLTAPISPAATPLQTGSASHNARPSPVRPLGAAPINTLKRRTKAGNTKADTVSALSACAPLSDGLATTRALAAPACAIDVDQIRALGKRLPPSGHTRENTMSAHTPNELHDAFPQAAEALHHLKLTNAHFARLAEQHHAVNREIHRIESEIEAASDERMEALKKERLHLLDKIAAMLDAEPAASGPA